MTVAAASRRPFAEASPADIRAALITEDQVTFDQQYRAALAAAGESYSLAELDEVLESWRRVARITTAYGQDAYRRMLAKAERRLCTGERPPDAVSADTVRALIEERLGR